MKLITWLGLHMQRCALVGMSVCALVFSYGTIHAADCDGVLQNVYEKLEVNESSYSSLVYAWRLSKMSAGEARSKVNGGLSVPIEGFPVRGDFSDEEFNAWREAVKSSVDFSAFTEQSRSVLQLTASTAVLSSWNQCIADQAGLVYRLVPQGSEIVFLEVRFIPNGPTSSAKVTTKLNLVGGQAVFRDEAALFDIGKSVGPASAVVQIRREAKDKPITISLNTDSGRVSAYVPGIVPIPSFKRTVVPFPNLSKWYWIREATTQYTLNVYAGAERAGRVAEPLCVAPQSPDQKWRFVRGRNDAFWIIASMGGLPVGRISRNDDHGAGICQGAANDEQQMWYLEPVGDGTKFRIRSRTAPTYLVLGAKGEVGGPHYALKQGNLAEASLWTFSEQGDL